MSLSSALIATISLLIIVVVVAVFVVAVVVVSICRSLLQSWPDGLTLLGSNLQPSVGMACVLPLILLLLVLIILGKIIILSFHSAWDVQQMHGSFTSSTQFVTQAWHEAASGVVVLTVAYHHVRQSSCKPLLTLLASASAIAAATPCQLRPEVCLSNSCGVVAFLWVGDTGVDLVVHFGAFSSMHELLPVSTKLQSTLRAIVGPGCLAAAAAELSPTSHPGLGEVNSSLFRGEVSASGISALRLVDGVGSGIGNNGGVPDGSSADIVDGAQLSSEPLGLALELGGRIMRVKRMWWVEVQKQPVM
ncbi:hypothetical protein Tco_0569143 [Tanacetum coccineum]